MAAMDLGLFDAAARGAARRASFLQRTPSGRGPAWLAQWTDQDTARVSAFGCVRLGEDGLRRMFELFNRLDTDGSGGLDESDFSTLESAICPGDAVRVTRRNMALKSIVDELKLSEADTDGDGTVDFGEFVEAFKRRALQEKLAGPAVEMTFLEYLRGLEEALNARVLAMVTQMAEHLAAAGTG